LNDKDRITEEDRTRKISRRGFLQVTGAVVLGAGAGVGIAACGGEDRAVCAFEIPASQGYLLVDTKKCQGCVTCMLACSLVHEGVASLSLARIQILQDSFESWPGDLSLQTCRQCVDPPCVRACPSGALQADPAYGYVRRVDTWRCIGCRRCVEVCPQTPSCPVAAPHEAYGLAVKSRKCDLCADTPYHWDPAGGGPDGKQACVEVCPVRAIAFTREVPEQEGDAGYEVNLRGPEWARLGFPTED